MSRADGGQRSQESNPYSTGGGGDVYQSNVGAYYLACLLVRGAARGLSGCVIEEVKLQRRFEDNLLDDIIVIGKSDSGRCKLCLQVKHHVTISQKDDVFERTILECYDTFEKADFQRDRDNFGLAVGITSADLNAHYQVVLTWALEQSSDSDFFALLQSEKASSKQKRNFVELVREKINQGRGSTSGPIDNNSLWRFFRSLVILHFDFGIKGSRDYAYIVDQLRYVTHPGGQNASKLFSKLDEYAKNAAPNAGSFDLFSLLQRLKTDGFSLAKSYPVQSDFEKLQRMERRALDDIRTTISGIELDRTSVLDKIRNSDGERHVVLVSGAPGSGKSAIMKALGESLVSEGNGLFFSADRIPSGGWDLFASASQLASPLEEVLVSLGTSGEPYLCIDSIDRLEPKQRLFVDDIVRQFLRVWSKTTARWSIVISARTKLGPDVLAWLTKAESVIEVPVPEVSDAEFDYLSEHIDRLKSLRSYFCENRILRIPKILDVALGGNLMDIVADEIISEVDVLCAWWNKIVAVPGAEGLDRKEMLLQAAQDIRQEGCRTFRRKTANVSSVHSLLQEDIISAYDGNSYRFSHDIYEEWAQCLSLNNTLLDLGKALASISQPMRLWRAVQLLSQYMLEKAPERWNVGLGQLSADCSMTLSQAYLVGFLHSVRADELLCKASSILLANDGRALQLLLTLLRTLEVNIDPSDASSSIGPIHELARHVGVFRNLCPRISVWQPVLNWCLTNIADFPESVMCELMRSFAAWQETTAPAHPLRVEIANFALGRWAAEKKDIRVWHRRDPALHKIIACSSDTHPVEVREYLSRTVRKDTESSEAIFSESFRPLVRDQPSTFVDFALDHLTAVTHYLTTEPTTGSVLDLELGLRHFSGCSPSYISGPFLYLLERAQDDGLRLILELVDIATKGWAMQEQERYRRSPFRLKINVGGKSRWLFGDYAVYVWSRPQGTVPNSLKAALMALEYWLEQRIAAGDSADELFCRLLQRSNSVAIAAVCIAVALAHPSKCLAAVLPLMNQGVLWVLDIERNQRDDIRFINYLRMYDRELYEAQRTRELMPHRFRDIRALIPFYLGAGDDIRAAYFGAVENMRGAWGNSWQTATLGEKDIAILQAMARQSDIVVVPGQEPRKLNEYIEPDSTIHRLRIWSYQSLMRAIVVEALSPDDVWNLIAPLRRNEDFESPITAIGSNDYLRLEAIAGCFAALLVSHRSWLLAKGHLSSAKDVLLKAIDCSYQDYVLGGSQGSQSLDPRYCAAIGLGSLVGTEYSDKFVEAKLMSLLTLPYEHLVGAAVEGAARQGNQCIAYCWKCLWLLLMLWSEESSWGWETGVRIGPCKPSVAVANLCDDVTTISSADEHLPDVNFRPWMLRNAGILLSGLLKFPGELYATNKTSVHALVARLMRWTENLLNSNIALHESDRWVGGFCKWLGTVQRHIGDDGVEKSVLPALGRLVQDHPNVVEAYLAALIAERINNDKHFGLVAEQWGSLMTLVFAEAHPRMELVGILLCMKGRQLLLEVPLTSLDHLTPLVSRWVDRFCDSSVAYSDLINFLAQIEPPIPVANALGWISAFVAKTSPGWLWNGDNGRNTLSYLIQVISDEQFTDLLRQDELHSQLLTIASSMAASGVEGSCLLLNNLANLARESGV